MPSFDVTLEPDFVELRNAVEQCNKEIGTRFDFKGSSAKVELIDSGAKGRELMLLADSEFQLGQVKDILLAKLAKRGVDVRYLDDSGKTETMGGDKVRRRVLLKVGIDSELGRRLQQLVKQSKLKVTASIQGDSVRVTGAKRDDLQAAIALLRREITDLPLKFGNPRE
jgi:cyclic-di-GMP-binding protein